MERLSYEPFGERLAPERDAAPPSRASKYLLWAGTGLFWSLVGAIVIARAVFFEPGVFDEFDRVAALVKARDLLAATSATACPARSSARTRSPQEFLFVRVPSIAIACARSAGRALARP